MAHTECNAHLRSSRPRPGPHPSGVCRCRDAIGISVIVAGGRVATLRLCQWCGDSWQVDGTPVAPEVVHSLVPQAGSAAWRTSPRTGVPNRERDAA